ncbi:MAG: hypothetical protein RQ838_04695 [Caldivirga sp.]|nr:hypothetical protein [Caldivirga sp.]
MSIQRDELREILETLRRIEDKLDKAGLSVLADVNLSTALTSLIRLLTEPKVIDLINKVTNILNVLSMIDPVLLLSLTYTVTCMNKAMSSDTLNTPNVTINELLSELSKPEYGKALGMILVMLRNASKCLEGGVDVKGSGA